MARFKDFLQTNKVPFTDADWNRDKQWLSDQVRYEFLFRAFDKKAADRTAFLSDPEVKLAVENLPKAQTLVSEADKVLAARRQ
jgi:carboxyl-terminal processing protease